jgi:hypothetical protein
LEDVSQSRWLVLLVQATQLPQLRLPAAAEEASDSLHKEEDCDN